MNKNDVIIRLEEEKDHRIVENIHREAFWNQSEPGAREHYFAHCLREHEDFVPELDFVVEIGGEVVGNIMYSKTRLVDESENEKQILSFGPIAILPSHSRRGYGKMLIERTSKKAKEMGWDVVAIFGNPDNYVSSGFKSCLKYNVCLEDDFYPAALLIKELSEGALDGRKWYFKGSDAEKCVGDDEKFEAFDAQFPPKEKCWQPSQEEFYIHSHSKLMVF